MPRYPNPLTLALLVAVLAMAPGRAVADLFSPPFLSYGTGGQPYPVAIADFNGDGHSDLATANWGSRSVSVLLGNGDGTFGPNTDYATGSGTQRGLAVADLNADQRPDLAVTTISGVSVLLGNGDGTFGPGTNFGIGAGFVAIGDLNGDARPDLVTTSPTFTQDWVSVLLGNGDGTFGPHTEYEAGIFPLSVAIGEVNGDGRLDLAVADNGPGVDLCPPFHCFADSSYVSVLLGNGDGTFGPRTGFRCGNRPWAIVMGDVNADGRPDLAAASAGSDNFPSSVSVLLGVGDGTFGPATQFGPGWVGGAQMWAAIADLNADGRLDLAEAMTTQVSVWLGNGNGTFGSRSDYGLSPGQDVGGLAVGELNGDGLPDLAVTGGYNTNTVTVLLHAAGPVAVGDDPSSSFALHASQPNPTTSFTRIAYDVPREANVTLRLFDAQGRAVRLLVSGEDSPGRKSVRWDLKDDQGVRVRAGIYFYRFRADRFEALQRVIVLD